MSTTSSGAGRALHDHLEGLCLAIFEDEAPEIFVDNSSEDEGHDAKDAGQTQKARRQYGSSWFQNVVYAPRCKNSRITTGSLNSRRIERAVPARSPDTILSPMVPTPGSGPSYWSLKRPFLHSPLPSPPICDDQDIPGLGPLDQNREQALHDFPNIQQEDYFTQRRDSERSSSVSSSLPKHTFEGDTASSSACDALLSLTPSLLYHAPIPHGHQHRGLTEDA